MTVYVHFYTTVIAVLESCMNLTEKTSKLVITIVYRTRSSFIILKSWQTQW